MYKINYLPQFAENGTNIQDLRQQIRDIRQANRIKRRENRLLNRLDKIRGNENTPVIEENTPVVNENRPATTDGLFSIPYLTLSLFPQPKPLLVRYLESMQPTTERTVASAQPSATTERTVASAQPSATTERTVVSPVKSDADYQQAVLDVIRGKYGNGRERLDKLNAAGFDYKKVQDAVNAKMRSLVESATTERTVASERVADGEYVNGELVNYLPTAEDRAAERDKQIRNALLLNVSKFVERYPQKGTVLELVDTFGEDGKVSGYILQNKADKKLVLRFNKFGEVL